MTTTQAAVVQVAPKGLASDQIGIVGSTALAAQLAASLARVRPVAHEIVVAVVVTDSGRPLPRVGGLTVGEIKGEDGLR